MSNYSVNPTELIACIFYLILFDCPNSAYQYQIMRVWLCTVKIIVHIIVWKPWKNWWLLHTNQQETWHQLSNEESSLLIKKWGPKLQVGPAGISTKMRLYPLQNFGIRTQARDETNNLIGSYAYGLTGVSGKTKTQIKTVCHIWNFEGLGPLITWF